MNFDDVFGTTFVCDRDTDTHRVCGICGELKPVEAFYKDGTDCRGKTKYRRDCRDCYKNQRIYEAKRKRASK